MYYRIMNLQILKSIGDGSRWILKNNNRETRFLLSWAWFFGWTYVNILAVFRLSHLLICPALPAPTPAPRHHLRFGRCIFGKPDKAQNKKKKKCNYLRYLILLYRAHSRLYRRRSLEVITSIHFSAFLETYKMCILLHRSNFSNLATFR